MYSVCQYRHYKAFVCNTAPTQNKRKLHKTGLSEMVIHEEKRETLPNADICNFFQINSGLEVKEISSNCHRDSTICVLYLCWIELGSI